jgi:hypothetical protein
VAEQESWAEPARKRFMDVAAELAAAGQLSKDGTKGMLTAGTLVLEYVGEDGDEWHTIIDLPRMSWRNAVVHLEMLRRYVQDALSYEDEDG